MPHCRRFRLYEAGLSEPCCESELLAQDGRQVLQQLDLQRGGVLKAAQKVLLENKNLGLAAGLHSRRPTLTVDKSNLADQSSLFEHCNQVVELAAHVAPAIHDHDKLIALGPVLDDAVAAGQLSNLAQGHQPCKLLVVQPLKQGTTGEFGAKGFDEYRIHDLIMRPRSLSA